MIFKKPQVLFYVLLLTGIFIVTCAVKAQDTDPRLIVPKFPGTIDSFEGEIFLPAYQMELCSLWPKDLETYNLVAEGGKNATVKMKIKGRLVRLSLQKAIDSKYVDVFSITSTVQGRLPGLIIEPKQGLILVSLKSNGLVFSHSLIHADPDPAIWDGLQNIYDMDCMNTLYLDSNQNFVWQHRYAEIRRDRKQTSDLIRDYCNHMLLGSHRMPPYYSLKLENDTIFIHGALIAFDPKSNFTLYYNDDGTSYLMLDGILSDFKNIAIVCSLRADHEYLGTLNITGNYKGILPLVIQFKKDNKVRFSAELIDKLILNEPKEGYPANLRLNYDLDPADSTCRVNLSSDFIYPNPPGGLKVNACGFKISPKFAKFTVGL